MSLEERIYKWLLWHHNQDPEKWLRKGEIEDSAREAGFLGETAGRKCRALEEKGLIEKRPCGISLEYRVKI